MRPVIIGLYGGTCTGKSTLGIELGSIFSSQYLSFGDIKREEIKSASPIGKGIEAVLSRGLPIPPELGFSILKNRLAPGLNLVSGYPISEPELILLSEKARLVAVILLSANETAIRERFFSRCECPLCHRPARGKTNCPEHQLQMVSRSEATAYEFDYRVRLFRDRILPFLDGPSMRDTPRLECDTTKKSETAVLQESREWLQKSVLASTQTKAEVPDDDQNHRTGNTYQSNGTLQ